MQLWEFYHITNPEILKKLAVACLNQEAATTTQQMVVFVTRQDLYRKRAKKMMELETQNVLKNSPKVKSILKLPYGAEINMIVSCGIREEKGVWGDRMRIPFNEVYQRI